VSGMRPALVLLTTAPRSSASAMGHVSPPLIRASRGSVRSTGGRAFTALALGLALLLAACASPVGVVRADPEAAQRSLTANVLSTGAPSAEARNVLHEEGLATRFHNEPEAALGTLHEAVVSGRRGASAVYALAELSYLHAHNTEQRPYYLAAAVYAWAYLFPTEPRDEPSPFDRRFRAAADLYNSALTEAFKSDDGERFEPKSGVFPLPFGELEVTFDESSLLWRGRRLWGLVPVTELEVRGLRARYRRDGLGAPLAASLRRPGPQRLAYDLVGSGVKVALTALLAIDRPQQALASKRISGQLTLHVASEVQEVTVGSRTVPLDAEPTAAVAYTLSDSPLWAREFRGLFRALIPNPGARTQLSAITPYRPGLMPVVFVHGTASSPGRWAEMYNRLANSSLIRGRYQFWFFTYDTGSPIAYSARLLRDALRQVVEQLDPEGRDFALRRLVLVGHSLGGLLVKMSVISTE
jgi:Alpha/beta hydrolase family